MKSKKSKITNKNNKKSLKKQKGGSGSASASLSNNDNLIIPNDPDEDLYKLKIFIENFEYYEGIKEYSNYTLLYLFNHIEIFLSNNRLLKYSKFIILTNINSPEIQSVQFEIQQTISNQNNSHYIYQYIINENSILILITGDKKINEKINFDNKEIHIINNKLIDKYYKKKYSKFIEFYESLLEICDNIENSIINNYYKDKKTMKEDKVKFEANINAEAETVADTVAKAEADTVAKAKAEAEAKAKPNTETYKKVYDETYQKVYDETYPYVLVEAYQEAETNGYQLGKKAYARTNKIYDYVIKNLKELQNTNKYKEKVKEKETKYKDLLDKNTKIINFNWRFPSPEIQQLIDNTNNSSAKSPAIKSAPAKSAPAKLAAIPNNSSSICKLINDYDKMIKK
jgi:hypothetical protein